MSTANFKKRLYSIVRKSKSFLFGLSFALCGVVFGAAGIVTYSHISAQKDNHLHLPTSDTTSSGKTQATAPEASEVDISNTKDGSKNSYASVQSTEQQSAPLETKADSSSDTDSLPPDSLIIEGVKIKVSNSTAIVTWSTSLSARSQLILDNGKGKGYESINGVGTAHEVDLNGLAESEVYDFKIVAHSVDNDLDDDYYGEIKAPKKYIVSLSSYLNDEDCRSIIIEDTAGYLAKNMTFTITGSYLNSSGTSFLIPHQTLTTDSNGEIEGWAQCNASKNATSVSIRIL